MSSSIDVATNALGTADPADLAEARLQLHHAAQLVASVARSYLPRDQEDAVANLGWSAAVHALVGRPVGPDGAVAAALRPADLTLALLDPAGRSLHELPLDGVTLPRAIEWLRLHLELCDLDPRALQLEAPYFLPDHDVSGGRPFREDSAPLAELAQWIGLGAVVLEPLAANRDDASRVRCWPHHFDLATLITIEAADDPERMKSVGVGLSPGDEENERPYFYVTPWPYPEPDTLPELTSGGRWITDGWVGGQLDADVLLAGDDPIALARRFVDEAVPVTARLVAALEHDDPAP